MSLSPLTITDWPAFLPTCIKEEVNSGTYYQRNMLYPIVIRGSSFLPWISGLLTLEARLVHRETIWGTTLQRGREGVVQGNDVDAMGIFTNLRHLFTE